MDRGWWQPRQGLWESFNTWLGRCMKAKGGSLSNAAPFHVHLCSVQVWKKSAADSWGGFIKHYCTACVFFKFKSGGHLKETNTGSAAAFCLYPCVHSRPAGTVGREGQGSGVTHGAVVSHTGQWCHTRGSSAVVSQLPAGHFPASRQEFPARIALGQKCAHTHRAALFRG